MLNHSGWFQSIWMAAPNDNSLSNQASADGASARDVLRCLLPDADLPEDMSEERLYCLIRQVLCCDRPRRSKLTNYNSLADAIDLFKNSVRILVLTGAGVSVSCGIPDFRSKDGIYSRLRVDYPDLPDPTAMFDISFFTANPKPFFKFARELFPGRYKPSICHRFIKALEDEGKLLRNYTQNIDTLEQVAGITRVVECHGSFAKATCRNCKIKVGCDAIREDIDAGQVAMCRNCNDPKGILKPDIVFFGEDLSEEFHENMAIDRGQVDLLVVIGSSLKVQPVAHIPYNISPDVPQILINRESLPHYASDIELLGNCDEIITQISLALGPPFTNLFKKGFNGIEETTAVSSKENQFPSAKHLINEMQFKKLLEEPETKRSRVEEECYANGDSRYIRMETKLPNDSFVFINPNKTIFTGAEMYYDKEGDVFCQLPNGYSSPLTSVSSSSSSSDSGGRQTDECRLAIKTLSLEDTFLPFQVCEDFDDEKGQERASSCPPFFHSFNS